MRRALLLLAALTVMGASCPPGLPAPGGRVCVGPLDCNCWELMSDVGVWGVRTCPSPSPSPSAGPAPSPSPSAGPPSPSPSPSPAPTPTPVPTPVPTPTPPVCVPTPGGVDCRPGCAQFWAEQIQRKAAPGPSTECHWHPVHGNTLLISHEHESMTPCRTAGCCEWQPTPADLGKVLRSVDRECNLRQGLGGGIVHRPESGYLGDLGCVVVPPTPCPSPSPSPGPTPSPSPSPSGPCPDIAGLGGQVSQFQLNHHTVTWRREFPGDIYVANGPADKVNFDTTVYYGCAAPRCDSEHDHSLARCEDLRGQRWRVLSGNVRNCEPTNGNGAEGEGRGFGFMCDAGPGEGAVEACTGQPWIATETGEHVRGSACKVIRFRIDG